MGGSDIDAGPDAFPRPGAAPERPGWYWTIDTEQVGLMGASLPNLAYWTGARWRVLAHEAEAPARRLLMALGKPLDLMPPAVGMEELAAARALWEGLHGAARREAVIQTIETKARALRMRSTRPVEDVVMQAVGACIALGRISQAEGEAYLAAR